MKYLDNLLSNATLRDYKGQSEINSIEEQGKTTHQTVLAYISQILETRGYKVTGFEYNKKSLIGESASGKLIVDGDELELKIKKCLTGMYRAEISANERVVDDGHREVFIFKPEYDDMDDLLIDHDTEKIFTHSAGIKTLLESLTFGYSNEEIRSLYKGWPEIKILAKRYIYDVISESLIGIVSSSRMIAHVDENAYMIFIPAVSGPVISIIAQNLSSTTIKKVSSLLPGSINAKYLRSPRLVFDTLARRKDYRSWLSLQRALPEDTAKRLHEIAELPYEQQIEWVSAQTSENVEQLLRQLVPINYCEIKKGLEEYVRLLDDCGLLKQDIDTSFELSGLESKDPDEVVTYMHELVKDFVRDRTKEEKQALLESVWNWRTLKLNLLIDLAIFAGYAGMGLAPDLDPDFSMQKYTIPFTVISGANVWNGITYSNLDSYLQTEIVHSELQKMQSISSAASARMQFGTHIGKVMATAGALAGTVGIFGAAFDKLTGGISSYSLMALGLYLKVKSINYTAQYMEALINRFDSSAAL